MYPAIEVGPSIFAIFNKDLQTQNSGGGRIDPQWPCLASQEESTGQSHRRGGGITREGLAGRNGWVQEELWFQVLNVLDNVGILSLRISLTKSELSQVAQEQKWAMKSQGRVAAVTGASVLLSSLLGTEQEPVCARQMFYR